MTLTQLEYITALDTYRNFSIAAEKCFITQPTLSMQIQKLEEELGIMIFDRSKQPVVATEVGQAIIDQARVILSEASKVKQIIGDAKNEVSGHLRIAIIPTLAPYLLPQFLPQFMSKYSKVKLTIEELVTEQIVYKLKNDLLDAGILATPLNIPAINEIPMFYEPFVSYISRSHKLFAKTVIDPHDIDTNDLWLLNEDHCLRSQVLNFCNDRKNLTTNNNIEYESGSLETLKKIVELNNGITLLPELSTLDLTLKQRNLIRYFREPEPVREISLVTHRSFIKKRIIQLLTDEIINSVPEKMHKKHNKDIIKIKQKS